MSEEKPNTTTNIQQDDNAPGTSGTSQPNTAIQNEYESGSEYSDSDPDDPTEYKVISQTITEDYENDLEKNLASEVKPKVDDSGAKKRRSIKKLSSKIPLHLKGLMGQANIMFAQGKHELTEKMCFEIIRQVPLAWEPYETLAQLYEPKHAAKSMQYLTIAAHLQSRNPYSWMRLAEMHTENNNLKMAVTCCTNAIAADPLNVELQYKRINLLERLEDVRFIQRCKMRLLNTLTAQNYQLILPLAKEVAEKYHADHEYQKAIEAMFVPFNKCPEYITPDLVNIMLELLLMTKSYTNCIDIFVQFCNIEIEIIINDNKKVHIVSYNMPESLPIDLRIKFILCLIKMEAYHLIDQLLMPLLNEETVETIGDLYLDVAEALMLGHKYTDALRLLIPLVKSKNFSLAAVWLKHAECLKHCDMIEQSIESYYTVVRMAPQHTEVRHALGELLVKVNKITEALKVMTQDVQYNEIDVKLLIKKIKLLESVGMYSEMYKSVIYMLSRHCILVRHYEEIREIIRLERGKDKIRILTQRRLRGDDCQIIHPNSINEPSLEEEYNIFRDALSVAYERKDYNDLQKMSITSVSSTRFKMPKMIEEIILTTLYACTLSGNLYHAYSLARDILLKKMDHQLSWNFFALMMQNSDENRYTRFLLRLQKSCTNDNLQLAIANTAITSLNTKFAMMQLVSLMQKSQSPYKFLLMTAIFIQFHYKKIVPLNRKYIMQIIYGFVLSYANTRSKEAQHEVDYNLGRLYQTFGLKHLAVKYYKKVLEFDNKFTEAYPDIVGLKREAAFNLHLIYKDSENYVAARNILMKYIRI